MPEPETRPAVAPDRPAAHTAEWAPDSPVVPDESTVTRAPSTPGPGAPDRTTRPDQPRLSSATADPEPAAPGAELPQIPGLRVEALVGSGGMGRVYRAVHPGLNRVVALKLITLAGRDETAARERFTREVQALARIDHPNVVPVYHAGEWLGFPYFTMKYVPGGPLSEHLGRFRADRRASVRLLARVARGVQALHDHGIIHRDLKPLNILVGEGDEPLVADFGLAMWLDSPGSDLTATHVPLGTRLYMSPEQTLGDKKRYGPGCDVWALGVMLHELLGGERPFRDRGDSDVMEQIRTADPSPLPADVPADLAAVVGRCLAKNPADRYPSAAAVADDLERWLAGEPVAAVPPVRMPGRGALLGVAAVAALIVLPAALLPRSREPVAEPTRPEVPAKSVAERLRAGETVTLIGPTGMPTVAAFPTPGFTGQLGVDRHGFCTLATAGRGAVEFVVPDLPPAYRLEAEVSLGATHGDTSWAGVYVGRKETPGPDATHHTHVQFVQWEKFSNPNRVRHVQEGATRGIAWSYKGWTPIVRFPPVEHAPAALPEAPGPTRWHRIEVEVTGGAVAAFWDGKRFPPLTARQFADSLRAVSLAGVTDTRPVFSEPFFGTGLGLCVNAADGSYRNVKLVPMTR